ncbi:MAG TPA: protein phosphatase 2C domain-containing protein [Vicinamibacterales bacterium]|nr:protein phosphatase 2C domain-containing protein [Vicinamibacterales bacterium]
MPLAAHGVTHPGRRTTNEDALLVDQDRGLFVVADGMGGHNAGEVASGLAVKAIGEFLSDGAAPSLNLLDEALRLANDHILAVAGQEPDYAGMGTTVVAVLLTDRQAIYANVGDSRMYLWRGGHLTQLTRDDSWVSAALEGVVEDARELEQHPMRHVLTKVVGLRPELQPSVAEVGFGVGDVLLLCSDGVHGSVPDAALAALLGGGNTVDQIADSVVRDAIARGATDNVTAIVVRRE